MTTKRQKEIRLRKQRRERIGKLKKQLAASKTIKERERLIDLIRRRNPFFTPEKS